MQTETPTIESKTPIRSNYVLRNRVLLTGISVVAPVMFIAVLSITASQLGAPLSRTTAYGGLHFVLFTTCVVAVISRLVAAALKRPKDKHGHFAQCEGDFFSQRLASLEATPRSMFLLTAYALLQIALTFCIGSGIGLLFAFLFSQTP